MAESDDDEKNVINEEEEENLRVIFNLANRIESDEDLLKLAKRVEDESDETGFDSDIDGRSESGS